MKLPGDGARTAPSCFTMPPKNYEMVERASAAVERDSIALCSTAEREDTADDDVDDDEPLEDDSGARRELAELLQAVVKGAESQRWRLGERRKGGDAELGGRRRLHCRRRQDAPRSAAAQVARVGAG